MARHEADREDLFAETRGIVPRIEFPMEASIALVGRKREGGLVVYLGQDRMYGFHPTGGLRRALADGLLYKAGSGRQFIRMRRDRSEGRHVLAESTLNEADVEAFLDQARRWLADALLALEQGDVAACRAEPSGDAASVRDELARELRRLLSAPLEVADGM